MPKSSVFTQTPSVQLPTACNSGRMWTTASNLPNPLASQSFNQLRLVHIQTISVAQLSIFSLSPRKNLKQIIFNTQCCTKTESASAWYKCSKTNKNTFLIYLTFPSKDSAIACFPPEWTATFLITYWLINGIGRGNATLLLWPRPSLPFVPSPHAYNWNMTRYFIQQKHENKNRQFGKF